MTKSRLWLAAAGTLAIATLTATPASAGTGCNGVINPFVWGCAPWDNNNGPNFPYWKAPRVSIPKDKAKVENVRGAQMVTDLRTGKMMPLIGNDGSTMVAAGGGN